MNIALAALQHSVATRVRADTRAGFDEALGVVQECWSSLHGEPVPFTTEGILVQADRIYQAAVEDIMARRDAVGETRSQERHGNPD